MQYRFFALFLFLAISVRSQDNNLFSKHGLGEQESESFAISNAMGGLKSAFRDRHNLNIANPASYSALELTTLEMGLRGISRTYTTASQEQFSRDVELSYLAIGLPIAKWWGGSFGIVPKTRTSYDFTFKEHIPSLDTVTYVNKGTGGTNKLFVGSSFDVLTIDKIREDSALQTIKQTLYKVDTGYISLPDSITQKKLKAMDYMYQGKKVAIIDTTYKRYGLRTKNIYHQLSLGFNVSYLFGEITTTDFTFFKDSTTFATPFSNRNTENILLSGINWELGLQYTTKLTNEISLTLGGSGRVSQPLQTNATSLWESFIGITENPLPSQIRDTSGPFITNGNAILPSQFQVGFYLSKPDHWKLGGDYQWQKWTEFRTPSEEKDTAFVDNYQLSLGGEFIPDQEKKGLKSIAYRAGLKIGTNRLMLNKKQLNQFGMTFGFGIPKRETLIVDGRKKRYTFYPFNVAFEIGTIGNINDNLIKQNYFKTTIGLSLNDKWFNKRKIE